MTSLNVYDSDAETIEEIAEKNDMTVAEVVEMLMDYVGEMKDDNYLS